jgi:hypothetical protein
MTALAYGQHVPIASLVMLPASNHERTRHVVLRIGTIVAAPFVTALRAAGIDVDQPARLELPAGDV